MLDEDILDVHRSRMIGARTSAVKMGWSGTCARPSHRRFLGPEDVPSRRGHPTAPAQGQGLPRTRTSWIRASPSALTRRRTVMSLWEGVSVPSGTKYFSTPNIVRHLSRRPTIATWPEDRSKGRLLSA